MEFEYEVKKLIALAFVPEIYVEEAFTQLVQTNYYTQNEQELRGLLDYFESNYIGIIMRGIRRNPLFQKSLWNVYDAAATLETKTINNIEGWHNAFGHIVGSHHPNIWNYFEHLKKSQALTELRMAHINSGQEYGPQLKYKKLWEKFLRYAMDLPELIFLDF